MKKVWENGGSKYPAVHQVDETIDLMFDSLGTSSAYTMAAYSATITPTDTVLWKHSDGYQKSSLLGFNNIVGNMNKACTGYVISSVNGNNYWTTVGNERRQITGAILYTCSGTFTQRSGSVFYNTSPSIAFTSTGTNKFYTQSPNSIFSYKKDASDSTYLKFLDKSGYPQALIKVQTGSTSTSMSLIGHSATLSALGGSSSSSFVADTSFCEFSSHGVVNALDAKADSNGFSLSNAGSFLDPSATLDVLGTFQYTDGNQAAGKVLTSDASGNATWQSVNHTYRGVFLPTYVVSSGTATVTPHEVSYHVEKNGTSDTLFVTISGSLNLASSNSSQVSIQMTGSGEYPAVLNGYLIQSDMVGIGSASSLTGKTGFVWSDGTMHFEFHNATDNDESYSFTLSAVFVVAL
jgi:hypothetical protein